MIPPDTPDDAFEYVARAISRYTHPSSKPLPISPYVAMSLLQKAIRRGQNHDAQRAAATLLEASPDRLWRRLAVIAVEDVGLGDPCTVRLVASALTDRRRLKSDTAVASYLVSRLAIAPKCRAADDLIMVATRHPNYLQARLELGYQSHEELVGVVRGTGPLAHRAIALMYLLGSTRFPTLITRRGNAEAALGAIDSQCTPKLRDVMQALFRMTREPLAPLLGLLSSERGWDERVSLDDPLPPEVRIGDTPGWAYDMFTREGRGVFTRFLAGNTKTSLWLRNHVAPTHRLELLSNLVFFVEGGCVRQRLLWPVGETLKRQAETECLGTPDATHVLGLLLKDLSSLNALRRKHIKGGLDGQ